MRAAIRAGVSLVALAGFFLLTFALIVGTALAAFALARYVTWMYWVAILAVFTGLIVLATLVKAAWTRLPGQAGAEVSAGEAPQLWALVTALAETAGTRGPDRIRLTADPNAAVSEESRLFGMLGGRRRMYLGIPLLLGLSVTQLRAVLAHEFGHYSSAHTRLGPIAYRGRQAVDGVMGVLQGNANWLMRILGFALRIPAGIYVLLSLAISRSQEREADRLMVQVAGRVEAQEALRDVAVIQNYWDLYRTTFLDVCWMEDFATTAEGFFGGFSRMLDACAEELAEARMDVTAIPSGAPAEKTRQDFARELLATHPPIPERIAALESIPAMAPPAPADERRAADLVPGDAVAAAAERCIVFGYRERLDWDDLITRAYAAGDQRFANEVYEYAAGIVDEPAATLGTVIAVAESGRMAVLVDAVNADRARQFDVVELFSDLVRAAAIGAGVAHWRVCWTGPHECVDSYGKAFDSDTVAALLADPATISEGRGRLAKLGIDVATAGPVAVDASAVTGRILAGFSGVTSDLDEDTTDDLLVLDTGLILARKPEQGFRWDSLEDLTHAGSVALLAARNRFIPYSLLASADVTGWVTRTVSVTRWDGVGLRLEIPPSATRLSTDSDEVLKTLLATVN